jgi:class 3 adenylate cyclase
MVCPRCGTGSPEGFKFCPACGGSLVAAGAPPPEERKVVNALFCDLVGFTASAEMADPEDIDRMLSAYFSMARSLIEAHGGVVEKFIGDAILGAPEQASADAAVGSRRWLTPGAAGRG